jgi:hypothetical protein
MHQPCVTLPQLAVPVAPPPPPPPPPQSTVPGTKPDPAAALAGDRSGRPEVIPQGIANADRQPTQPRPMSELCDCYQEHFDGKCECGCCCPCVLVGKIQTTRTDTDVVIGDRSVAQGLFVDRQWVRWIRPVLVGYYKCMTAVSRTAGTDANMKTITR